MTKMGPPFYIYVYQIVIMYPIIVFKLLIKLFNVYFGFSQISLMDN